MEVLDLLPLLMTVGGVFLVSGILVGYLLSGMFRGNKDEVKPRRSKPDEALCVLRDPATGALRIEIEKLNFHLVDDMTVAQHARLVKLLGELNLWAGTPAPAATPVQAPSESDAGRPLQARVPLSETGKAEPVSTSQPEKVKPVSSNLVDMVARAVTAGIPKDPAKPKSIAAQVDEILQEKLEHSPLKERAIRLMELPDKGLVVMVGMEQYNSVSEVPYPEVKELLRESVREWEQRTGNAKK